MVDPKLDIFIRKTLANWPELAQAGYSATLIEKGMSAVGLTPEEKRV